MNHPPLRVAVLISGTGSNLKTLIEARASGELDIDLVLVISSRADAPGLNHARAAGIPYKVFSEAEAERQDHAVTSALVEARPELVVLAGYMRILGAEPVQQFQGSMINLHPSLLPLYPGLDTYRRCLEAGDSEHGGSIHFVIEELDAGPVIGQVRIPVSDRDSAQSLASRLGPREHALLRATVELFTQRRVEMDSGLVLLDGKPLDAPLLLNEDDQFTNC